MSDNAKSPAPEAAEAAPPAAVPEAPAPAPEATQAEADLAAAVNAVIEAHDALVRLLRQAVGAIPALGGLGHTVDLAEMFIGNARKAMSPPG